MIDIMRLSVLAAAEAFNPISRHASEVLFACMVIEICFNKVKYGRHTLFGMSKRVEVSFRLTVDEIMRLTY